MPIIGRFRRIFSCEIKHHSIYRKGRCLFIYPRIIVNIRMIHLEFLIFFNRLIYISHWKWLKKQLNRTLQFSFSIGLLNNQFSINIRYSVVIVIDWVLERDWHSQFITEERREKQSIWWKMYVYKERRVDNEEKFDSELFGKRVYFYVGLLIVSSLPLLFWIGIGMGMGKRDEWGHLERIVRQKVIVKIAKSGWIFSSKWMRWMRNFAYDWLSSNLSRWWKKELLILIIFPSY